MIVYRLSKSKYSSDLTGKGAEKTGGRWNSKGTSMIYTSDSRALCTAEIAVHTPLGILPFNYEIITLEIPDKVKMEVLNKNQWPEDWRLFPHPHSTQQIGDAFVSSSKALVLKVPSAAVQGEFNYLITPLHQDIKLVEIISVESFNFDLRLFVK